ncbi:distant relative of cell wall-associated hydrolase [Ramlibacter sp. PS4R-6]|uniref:distant relative of cell wall-associated hydrolase n=1 Tax=Ramlibacter sp. PS4R-6 TaxID=3133438 RepID=UPI00309A4301
MLSRRHLLALPAWLLAGCATSVWDDPGAPQLRVQDLGLNPGNGGVAIAADALAPGDIVLSAAPGIGSIGVRLVTLSPVSHASLYVGDGEVAEAVTHGIQRRRVAALLEEESTVVAFRHPAVQAAHIHRMREFVGQTIGRPYDLMGVMLQAPFTVDRRLCEVPLMPAPLRDACLQGLGAVHLGVLRNDRFFCSAFVLEAYRQAGLPLTDADPRLLSPADLLHMREGDVPSVRAHQSLRYVGHLKFQLAVS